MRIESDADLPSSRARELRTAARTTPRSPSGRLDQRERMARQLALARHILALVVWGEGADPAEIARLRRISRARVSQIDDRLAPSFAVQELAVAASPPA